MKKVLGVVLLLVVVSSIGFAQLGIKGGLSLGTFSGDDSKFFGLEPQARSGFTAGVYYNIGLLLGLSIQPEVSYTHKGAMYQDPTGKITMKHDYLDIPVVVKWAPLPIPVIKPYVEGGIAYSTLMSAKWKSEPGTESDQLKDDFEKSDLSIVLGAGVNFALGVIDLTVNARYMMGQKTIDKPVAGAEAGKVYNRAVLLTAGVNF